MIDFILSLLQYFIKYLPLICGGYVSIMILRIPDLTIEVSWSLSGIIACMLTTLLPSSISAFTGLLVGGMCGLTTGLIFMLIGKKKLLSGLISYTLLIAIGYRILGDRANIFLNTADTKFGIHEEWESNIYYSVVSTFCFLIVYFWERSKLGIRTRIIGENPFSSIFYKISVNKTYLGGLILSNSLIGLGGSLWGVYFGYASNTQGIGLVFTTFLSLLLGNEIRKILKISNRVNTSIILLGTSIYVLFIQLIEHFSNLTQILGFDIKATDKNLLLALFLLVLISINRSSTNKREFISEW